MLAYVTFADGSFYGNDCLTSGMSKITYGVVRVSAVVTQDDIIAHLPQYSV